MYNKFKDLACSNITEAQKILLTVFHDNLEKIIAHLTKRIKQTKILNIPPLQG